VSVDEFFDRSNLDTVAPVADGIDLWWCALERAPDEADRFTAWLSPAEHARAARFGTDTLRRRWITGRAALRFVLGRALGIAPPAVPIRRGARGRPELTDCGVKIDFNVSHTRGVALIGVAAGCSSDTRIGVDVERSDRDVGADRLARKFLTPGERSAIAQLSPDLRRQRFLRYWTCKEAMSKATGDGLIAPFGKLEVGLDAGLHLLAGPPPYTPPAWNLLAVAVPAGYLATIAVWHRGR
jgi:4'-phosphopantetheinyl transferase